MNNKREHQSVESQAGTQRIRSLEKCETGSLRSRLFCRDSGSENKLILNSQNFFSREDEFSNFQIVPAYAVIEGKRYDLIEVVGVGAHGIVLKVEEPGKRFYALKVPLEFNERFSNSQGNRASLLNLSRKYVAHEVEMLKKLTGPGLLEVFYAGPVICRSKDAECRFPGILMELALATLKDLMDMQMALQLEIGIGERIDMIRQLAEDLRFLHQTGTVHRDLSPHNIFVVERNNEIRYVLGDMGTSKPANVYDVNNSTTRMAFHDRYLDPALLAYDGFRYDKRLDIYQIGVMIAEIWIGEYWQAEDGDSTMHEMFSMDFEKDFLGKLVENEIPEFLLRVLRKATTSDINRRYRSVEGFKQDLDAALRETEIRIERGEKGEKGTGQKKTKEFFKKNIAIAYNRQLCSEDMPYDSKMEIKGAKKGTAQLDKSEILYKGQRKIDLGGKNGITIIFSNEFTVRRAVITGDSFLECALDKDRLHLNVNINRILDTVSQIKNNKRLRQTSWRLEFEGRSILFLEGTLAGTDNKSNGGGK